jgi:hypothetical protein
MKNWYGFFVFVMLLLIVGGGLTVIANSGETTNQFEMPFVLRQTDDPEGSSLAVVPWKMEQFFLALGFILFNIIGIGLTLMLLVWFLNRQVSKVKAEGSAPAASTAPTTTE